MLKKIDNSCFGAVFCLFVDGGELLHSHTYKGSISMNEILLKSPTENTCVYSVWPVIKLSVQKVNMLQYIIFLFPQTLVMK